MSRIFLFALIFSMTACKLEPIEQTNELENGDLNTGGNVNPGTEIPATSTWITGTLALYTINPDDLSISGRFSVVVNGTRVNHVGDFVFSEADDFNYFVQNKELFEVANNVPLTVKVKLLRKGSSCAGSPESEYCATVITPDVFEIEDIQTIE